MQCLFIYTRISYCSFLSYCLQLVSYSYFIADCLLIFSELEVFLFFVFYLGRNYYNNIFDLFTLETKN